MQLLPRELAHTPMHADPWYGTGRVRADVALATQCGQRSDFFIIYSNGVQLDFVAFGITLVRSAARNRPACHSVWRARVYALPVDGHTAWLSTGVHVSACGRMPAWCACT